jgi:hypothetical protein
MLEQQMQESVAVLILSVLLGVDKAEEQVHGFLAVDSAHFEVT